MYYYANCRYALVLNRILYGKTRYSNRCGLEKRLWGYELGNGNENEYKNE